MAPCSAIMVEVATVIAGFPFQSASLLGTCSICAWVLRGRVLVGRSCPKLMGTSFSPLGIGVKSNSKLHFGWYLWEWSAGWQPQFTEE